MRVFNPRAIVLRIIIIVILGAFVYPFLPAKQQWQLQAAFGDDTADSLLWEYYRPPVEGALQFALEFPFQIKSPDGHVLVQRRDVRYVEIGDMLWREGRQWVVHLRRDAVGRIAEALQNNPGEPLQVELDVNWSAPLMVSEAQSPLYIDPGLFANDPSSLVWSAVESWYALP